MRVGYCCGHQRVRHRDQKKNSLYIACVGVFTFKSLTVNFIPHKKQTQTTFFFRVFLFFLGENIVKVYQGWCYYCLPGILVQKKYIRMYYSGPAVYEHPGFPRRVHLEFQTWMIFTTQHGIHGTYNYGILIELILPYRLFPS